MFIDVAFAHAELARAKPLRYHLIAVIDVLRATTTITTALENGAQAVVPVAAPGEARRRAEELRTQAGKLQNRAGAGIGQTETDVLLGGERHARIIPGFDLGNSPLEYTVEIVKDKVIVLTTTNGTSAFQRVQRQAGAPAESRGGLMSCKEPGPGASGSLDAEPIIVAACLRNAGAVAKAALSAFGRFRATLSTVDQEFSRIGNSEPGTVPSGFRNNRLFSVLIVCAGTEGRFSWDDAYCAGVIATELVRLVQSEMRLDRKESLGSGWRGMARAGAVAGPGTAAGPGTVADPGTAAGPGTAASFGADVAGTGPGAGSVQLGDGARAALNMVEGLRSRSRVGKHSGDGGGSPEWPHSYEQLAASHHGRRLLAMGLEEDVRFCAETNKSMVVPR